MPLRKPQIDRVKLLAEMPKIITSFESFDKSKNSFEQAFFDFRLKPSPTNEQVLSDLTDEVIFNFRDCVADIISDESDESIDSQADQILTMINSENIRRSKFIKDSVFSCDNTCELFEAADDDLRELDTDIYTELIDSGKDIDTAAGNIANKFADFILDDVMHFSRHVNENIQPSPIDNIKSSARVIGYYGLLATGVATTVSLLQIIK